MGSRDHSHALFSKNFFSGHVKNMSADMHAKEFEVHSFSHSGAVSIQRLNIQGVT